jgi:hypothetical protein
MCKAVRNLDTLDQQLFGTILNFEINHCHQILIALCWFQKAGIL